MYARFLTSCKQQSRSNVPFVKYPRVQQLSSTSRCIVRILMNFNLMIVRCSRVFEGWAYLTVRILNRERYTRRIIIVTCLIAFTLCPVRLNRLNLHPVRLNLPAALVKRRGCFLSEFVNSDKVSLISGLIDSIPVSHTWCFNIDTRASKVSGLRLLYLLSHDCRSRHHPCLYDLFFFCFLLHHLDCHLQTRRNMINLRIVRCFS